MRERLATARFESPVGAITLTASDAHLASVRIGAFGVKAAEQPSDHPILAEAKDQFYQWFNGNSTDFDLPLAPLDSEDGARLRSGIAAIPYGETRTYGALGEIVGSIARAVGQACKTNPYPIIIPCHRVVSTAGPEYYSGGSGPRTKTWLLDFEYENLPSEKRTRLL